MPEEVYHKQFALSASGIKKLRISTMNFWAASVMNPLKDEDSDETEAKGVGKAYHKRILEGRDAFYNLYGYEFEAPERDDWITTGDDLKKACAEQTLPVTGTKPILIKRLLDKDPTFKERIYDLVEADYITSQGSRTLLPKKTIQRLEIAASMIERDPQLTNAFRGGYPEVSIFWTDEETGVPCKIRVDYLKPAALVELKSFGNDIGQPIHKAVARAVASYKYHIAARFYLDGVKAAKKLIAAGKFYPDPKRSPDSDLTAFLDGLIASQEMTYLFVFQQTGPAPVVRGRILAPGLTMDLGRVEIDDAKARFKHAAECFGADPWIDAAPIETFDSCDFPAYIAD